MSTSPHLFALADAGAITLPAAITDLRAAAARYEEHRLTEPLHYLAARAAVTAATVEAVLAGTPLPDVDPVLDAERAARAYQHQVEVARDTAAELDARLSLAISEHAEHIFTDTLRPIFDTTVKALQSAYRLLEPFEGASPGAIALASTKVRNAAGTVDQHVLTYSQVRAAAAELRRRLSPPEYDLDAEFASWKDIHTVWPRARRSNFGSMPAPWENAPDQLAWQFRHLTPWLPTPAEQDAAWLEVYGEQLREQQEKTNRVRAVHETHGV